jgi:hypothetical protein
MCTSVHIPILRPICTYIIPLWGTASNSNIEMLERYQNKVLRTIVNVWWYISNKALHADLNVPRIREQLDVF